MLASTSGTPVVGYLSLSSGSPGPTAVAFSYADGTNRSYTFVATERLYITTISISSNDTAGLPLVTVDSGGAAPSKLARVYVGQTLAPPFAVTLTGGAGRLQFGIAPRATASAITAGKTVECVVTGFISRT